MSGLVGGELLGAGSVRLAGGDDGGGGAGTITEIESTDGTVVVTNGAGPVVDLSVPGNPTPAIVGKFTGTIFPDAGAATFSYLADPGQLGPTITGNETSPQLYPSSARTISTLRVVAKTGNGGTPYQVTLYKNGAPTSQTVTIPAGAAAGASYVDAGHPIAFADGDQFDVRVDKAATGDGIEAMTATLEGPSTGGGGGGGGVVTDATLTGTGTLASPLHAVAQFGQDTIIKIDDTGGTPVNALELIASLTDPTPGATYSQWIIETLLAGVQTQAIIINGLQSLFPAGTAANPGVGFIGRSSYGMGYNAGIDGLVWSVAGATQFGVYAPSQFLLYSNSAAVIFGTTQTEKIVRNGIQLQFYANGTVNFSMTDVGIGFYGAAAAAKPNVTGSKGGNAALASLLTGLASLGLLTDSST